MERLEEPLINELLLVGSALGSIETITTEDGSLIERFIRGENCLEWLQDLQRALRRDDDFTRAVAVKLGAWKVVETKLLPLMLECRDDLELVVTLIKIFVMLTMPLHPSVKNYLLVDVVGNDDPEIKAEKVRRKATARAQVSNLLAMKRAFVNAEVIAVLVATLEEPLGNNRGGRSEEDTLIIELVLTLLRNLLSIEDEAAVAADRLHNEMLLFLEQEYALEVVLFLCQGVQARDNVSWNLLLMEVVFHIVRGQDPADVAAAAAAAAAAVESDGAAGGLSSATINHQFGGGVGSLALQKDELSRSALSSRSLMSRHNRFGTQLKLSDPTGVIRVVAKPYYHGSSVLDSLPQAHRKRNRRNAIFLVGGAGGSTGGGGSSGGGGSGGGVVGGSSVSHDPVSARAHACLARLAESFIENAYEPLIRSLKDEFRRDSSRLEADDRIVFFRITRFFLAFNRFVKQAVKEQRGTTSSLLSGGSSSSSSKDWTSSLVQSMDVLSFNLVLSTMDTLMAEKGYRGLVHALALYKEMIHFLATLAYHHHHHHGGSGADDDAHGLIATGLQHKLFYAPEPVDKLSRILACWKPGLFPRSFLADIIDLAHTQIALLEANARLVSQAEEASHHDVEKATNVSSSREDVVRVAKGFDFQRYFANLCTNQVVRMLTYLLEQYKVNSLSTNKQILSFFQRMRHIDLDSTRARRRHNKNAYDDEEDLEMRVNDRDKNTLEPMLFNVPLLLVLHRILDDRSITSTTPLYDLQRFAKSLVRHFGEAATWNPLLLVEAMFQHPFPHHWCANFQKAYLSQDHLHTVAKASKQQRDEEDEEYQGGDEDDEGSEEESSEDEATQKEAAEAAAMAAKDGLGGGRADGVEKKKKKKRKKKAQEERKGRGGHSSSEEEEEEWDGMVVTTKRAEDSDGEDDEDGEGTGKATGKQQKKKKKRAAPPTKRAAKWDFDEDSALRKHYGIYKGTKACLEVLAKVGPIHKKGRTTLQIKRRLQFLKIWEKPGATTNEEAAAGGGGAASDPEDDQSKASSSDSDSSSSSSRAKKKAKAAAAAGSSLSLGEVTEATAVGSTTGGEDGMEGANNAGEAEAVVAPPKKKRLRKQQESDESSSDESLDILE